MRQTWNVKSVEIKLREGQLIVEQSSTASTKPMNFKMMACILHINLFWFWMVQVWKKKVWWHKYAAIFTKIRCISPNIALHWVHGSLQCLGNGCSA